MADQVVVEVQSVHGLDELFVRVFGDVAAEVAFGGEEGHNNKPVIPDLHQEKQQNNNQQKPLQEKVPVIFLDIEPLPAPKLDFNLFVDLNQGLIETGFHSRGYLALEYHCLCVQIALTDNFRPVQALHALLFHPSSFALRDPLFHDFARWEVELRFIDHHLLDVDAVLVFGHHKHRFRRPEQVDNRVNHENPG